MWSFWHRMTLSLDIPYPFFVSALNKQQMHNQQRDLDALPKKINSIILKCSKNYATKQKIKISHKAFFKKKKHFKIQVLSPILLKPKIRGTSICAWFRHDICTRNLFRDFCREHKMKLFLWFGLQLTPLFRLRPPLNRLRIHRELLSHVASSYCSKNKKKSI